jgi:hypothetical protein
VADLETAGTVGELQSVLDNLAPGATATDEMRRRLREGAPLSPVLDRLIRFEAG